MRSYSIEATKFYRNKCDCCRNRGITRPLFSSPLSQFHRWLLKSNYEYAVQLVYPRSFFCLLLRLEHHACRYFIHIFRNYISISWVFRLGFLGFLFYVIRVRVAQAGRMHQHKINSQKHTCERKRIAYLSGTPLPRIALPYSMALLETILPWVALPWPPTTPHVDVLYLKVQVIWVAVSVEIFRYVAPLEEDLCWNGLGKPGRVNQSKAESF